MDDPTITVRTLRKTEIPNALQLWKDTGYPEGNYCIETWYEIDSEGFQIAVTDKGEIIGICIAIINHEDLVHVGMYAVNEKYRGQGIGMKIWNVCLEHIGARNAVVNAVPGKLEAYRDRGGFPIHEERWNSFYCQSHHVNIESLLAGMSEIDVVPISDDLMELLLDYDMNLVQYDRSKAVKLTINEKDSTSFIAIADGKCVGYGTYKLTCLGIGMVGPLYADSQDIAEVLLKRLIETLPQAKGFCMMIIDANERALSVVKKLGDNMSMMEVPRLYRKYKVDIDVQKVFGHFNLNFCPY